MPRLSAVGISGLQAGEDVKVAMVIALSSLVLIYAGLRWRWHSHAQRDPTARAWQRFCERLARRGLARDIDEGPLAFAERIAERRPDLAESVWKISRCYAALRYGPVTSSAAVRQLQRWVQRFRV